MQNNRRSILLICNTPFQIIMACHIIGLYYREYDVDIAISEGIKDGLKLVNNAISTNYFRKVIYIRNKKTFLTGKGLFKRLLYLAGRVKEVFFNYRIAYNLTNRNYDVCLFSNISMLTKLLGTFMKKNNPDIKLAVFEEGIVTYTKLFSSCDAPSTLYSKVFDKKGLLSKINLLYVCYPNLLEWSLNNGEVVKLPIINKNDKEYISLLNAVFGCREDDIDIYDKRVIFFEESHSFEGFKVPDIDIVNKIADKVGRENIMVKIHPRNPNNRFSQLGYKTNENVSIPWELIVLNQFFEDKIFVTISSGAVISPYLYIGMPCVSYSLLNCVEERPGYMNGELGDMMQRIYNKYPEVFVAPESMESFLLCL